MDMGGSWTDGGLGLHRLRYLVTKLPIFTVLRKLRVPLIGAIPLIVSLATFLNAKKFMGSVLKLLLWTLMAFRIPKTFELV